MARPQETTRALERLARICAAPGKLLNVVVRRDLDVVENALTPGCAKYFASFSKPPASRKQPIDTNVRS
jgi:hypothetical protein